MGATSASRAGRCARNVQSHICAIHGNCGYTNHLRRSRSRPDLQRFAVPPKGRAHQNEPMPELVALQRICGLLDRGEIDGLDVRSMLDVSFSVNGNLYGCFSCEQIGGTQSWTPHQVKLLRRMASRVSLALMNAITSNVDTAPGALWEPSTPNRLMTMPM